MNFIFTFNFTVATKTAAARFVTCDRYLCEWLVTVLLKAEVQNERDFVEIIRVQLCRAQYHCKLAAVSTSRSEGFTTFFHSHPRHFVNLFPVLVSWASFSFFPYLCSVSIHFSRPLFLLLIYFTVTSHTTRRFQRRMYSISDLRLPTQCT